MTRTIPDVIPVATEMGLPVFDDTPIQIPTDVAPAPQRPFMTGFGMQLPRLQSGSDGPGTDKEEKNNMILKKKEFFTILYADYLIPGDGEPSHQAAVVLSGKLIDWVGRWTEVPAKYRSAPFRPIRMPVVMPGLWDCHVHMVGASPEDARGYATFLALHPAEAGARLARGCWEALQKGYTSLRDVAGYGCEVAKAVEDGTIVGPNIYSSGAALSQTAGHGDVFDMAPGDVLMHSGVGGAPYPGQMFGSGIMCLVDGVDECRKATRLQIRRGAKCIKVLASGGIMSRDDDPTCAQFSAEELRCVVEEATRQKRSVAAHVHGKPGILAAVKAGVTTLEHVSFADDECIRLIKEKGTVYVATRYLMEILLSAGPENLPKYIWDSVKVIGNNHEKAYRLAIEQGVTFALGTDSAPESVAPEELEAAVKCGMTPLQAIKAATANGPLTVGAMAPNTGQIKAGYEADILGLVADPVKDITVLQNSNNVKWVFKGGRMYKGPGVGPWGEGV